MEKQSESTLSHKFFPVLITDIGGTNSRMRIIQISSNPQDNPKEIDYKKLKSSEYKSLEHVCEEYLKPFLGTENFPIMAVIAIPGPIIKNICTITANLKHWGVSDGNKISTNLKIPQVHLLNDFQVMGYGVMSNTLVLNKDLFVLNDPKTTYEDEPIAVLGPGTGLGHGIGVKSKTDKYHEVYSSEGGHQIFIAHTEREWRYRCYLAKKLNLTHVSHERGCSGPAIPYMFNFLIDEEKMECKLLDMKDSEFETKRWKLTSESIVESACKGDCPVTQEVRKLFVELIASACSNFCLLVVPLNGLYLVGSIANSFSEFIKNDNTFMNRYTDKGRLHDFMKQVPIYLVTNQHIGLLGSEEFARRIIERQLANKELS